MQLIFLLLALVIAAAIIAASLRKKAPLAQPDAETEKQILEQHVLFYRQLSPDKKMQFEQAVRVFLSKVRITGIKITLEDTDKVFVAAAAIIPIFGFAGWEYRNIHEVLLYPESFSEDYHTEGKDRNILGMVGSGAMQYVMILSQRDLRAGFINHTDKSNTAIHEFVHLVDKSDGDTDGFPGALITHAYAVPWLRRIHEEMQRIRSGHSDINPYGAVNEAEFLAVAAEYFFEQPHLMEQKHPELYALLKQAFMPSAV